MGTNERTQEHHAGCRIQQLDLDRREKKMATQHEKINADIARIEQDRTNNNTSYIEKIDCLSTALSESTRKCFECESAVKDLHEQLENVTCQSQSDAKTLQGHMDSRVGNLKERLVLAKNALSGSNIRHEETCQEMKKQSKETVAPMTSEIKSLKMQLQKYEKEVCKLVKNNEANVQCYSDLQTKTSHENTVQMDKMSLNLKSKHQEDIDKLVKKHDAIVKDYVDSKKLSACANAANLKKVSNDMKIMYENDAHKESRRTQSIIQRHEDKLCKCQTESERLVKQIRQYESNSKEWKGKDTELSRICCMIVSSLPENVKTQTIETQQKFVDDVLQSLGHT
jgi:hypothetical protein